jgi:hypothetical protein
MNQQAALAAHKVTLVQADTITPVELAAHSHNARTPQHALDKTPSAKQKHASLEPADSTTSQTEPSQQDTKTQDTANKRNVTVLAIPKW